MTHIEPMPSPFPIVFDRPLARSRLRRALASPSPDFLAERASEDLIGRLQTVQRRFNSVVDVGSPDAATARAIAAMLPGATLIRIAPAEPAIGAGPWLGLVGDEERLPLRDGQFDLAVAVLGLHAVNDLPGALTQIRRALRPDGLFLAALLGGQTLQELRAVLAEAEAEITGGASPRVAPFSDLRDLGGAAAAGGVRAAGDGISNGWWFATLRCSASFAICGQWARQTSWPIGAGRFSAAASSLRAAALYSERFADADGRLRATFDIVWLSGWSPHESQQKPMKPGSAKVRLADALGVSERKV